MRRLGLTLILILGIGAGASAVLVAAPAAAMTKADLIDSIADRTGVSKQQASAALEAFLHETVGTLPGERVNRPAFGSGLMELVGEPNRAPLGAWPVRMSEGNRARVGFVKRRGHSIAVEIALLPGVPFLKEGTLDVEFRLPRRAPWISRHPGKHGARPGLPELVQMELLLPPADVIDALFGADSRARLGSRPGFGPVVRIAVEIPSRAFEDPAREPGDPSLGTRLFRSFLPDLHPPLAEECGAAVLEAELEAPGLACDASTRVGCTATAEDLALLGRRVAEAAGVDLAVALEAIDVIASEAASIGEPGRIVGFGSFTVRQRPARRGINPFTGEPVVIRAKQSVRATPLKALKDLVQ